MRTSPSLSVAMATYNGERFLAEQLDSIARQTCLPDELVVCDDTSEDGTVGMVKEFSKKAPFPVRLYVNPTRLGTSKNFGKAISLCRGELIAVCDQDDIWLPAKLEQSSALFRQRPDVGLVFTNARIISELSKSVDGYLWDNIGFSDNERELIRRGRAFQVLVRHNVVTGMTMVFRARYRDICLPIPDSELENPKRSWRSRIVHDAWLALLIAAVAEIDFVERPLVQYRQHDTNQIGSGPRGRKSPRLGRGIRYGHRLALIERAAERLSKMGLDSDRDERMLLLKQQATHVRARHEALTHESMLVGIGRLFWEVMALRYHRCNRKGWRKLSKDLEGRCRRLGAASVPAEALGRSDDAPDSW